MKKKWLLLIVVAVVNALLVAGLGYASLALMLIASVGGTVLSVLFVLAQAAGLFFVERQFLKRQWCGRVKFWCISSIPPVILSGIGFAVVCVLDSKDYFTGLFPGLGEFLITMAFLLYSIVLMTTIGIAQFFIKKTLKTS